MVRLLTWKLVGFGARFLQVVLWHFSDSSEVLIIGTASYGDFSFNWRWPKSSGHWWTALQRSFSNLLQQFYLQECPGVKNRRLEGVSLCLRLWVKKRSYDMDLCLCLSMYLSTYLSVCLSVCLSVRLSVCLCSLSINIHVMCIYCVYIDIYTYI